jgi:rare lipoprotein A
MCNVLNANTARPNLPKVTAQLNKKIEYTTVSWYGEDFHGKTMKNGERFDMFDPSIVASKTLPIGTKVRITNLNNGKTIEGVVKDLIGKNGRTDLSRAGAEALGYREQGITKAKIEVYS